MVIDGTIVTPPLSSGLLAGITREVILEWCDVEERDFSCWPRPWPPRKSSSPRRRTQAVRRWDDTDFGTSHPITDRIATTFAQQSSAVLDP